MSHLKQLRLPCILHWDHSHFVVLTQVGARTVIIHDPASGRRKIALEEVSRRFTGIALEAWTTEGFERKTDRARIRVFDLLRARGFPRRHSDPVMSLFLGLSSSPFRRVSARAKMM
jgi:ATP-binding cassette subfamily B protein RaxB